MKRIGVIDISFRNYENGIFYYDLSVQIQNKKRNVVLPRYNIFLGWIEIFGLPPQNEWVVISDIDDFTKTGDLVIDGRNVKESVTYTADKASFKHTIETVRETNKDKETHTWTQNYKNAPESITSEGLFKHKEGAYSSHWTTCILKAGEELPHADLAFVENCKSKHGAPSLLIKKEFTASGVLPPLYYSLFPVDELLDLTEISGSVIEIGYLKKDSTYEIDRAHGDWYKKFDFGEQQLYVFESNYTSCDLKTEAGVKRIKDTYRKELFITE